MRKYILKHVKYLGVKMLLKIDFSESQLKKVLMSVFWKTVVWAQKAILKNYLPSTKISCLNDQTIKCYLKS